MVILLSKILKMRILNINIFFGKGSTGKIVQDIHTRLERDGYESFVVYGLNNKVYAECTDRIYKMTSDFWAIQYGRIARILGLRYNCAYIETYKLTHRIKKIKPDIVHLHCMNCSYINPFMLLKWLGKQNYKVLVTHHADVTITANCDHAYECDMWKTGCKNNCEELKRSQHYYFCSNAFLSWKQMYNAFKKVRYLYASGVSRWMAERVKQSPFFSQSECWVIENGVDVESFKYDENNENQLCNDLKLQGYKVVLHVTPSILQPLKGSQYVLDLANRMPYIKFIIVGYKNERIDNLPDNVILIPHTNSKRELASYYQGADVSILTSKRESFSLVTAESLCCGTPIVGFKAGAPETIAIPEFSSFVDYGKIELLKQQLEIFLAKKFEKKTISELACRRYDSEGMYQKYLAYYRKIISDVKG